MSEIDNHYGSGKQRRARKKSSWPSRRITLSGPSIASLVDENPVMVAVAGLAAGLLLGALLPGTNRENELVGRFADDVRAEGKRYAVEAVREVQEAVHGTLQKISK